MSCRYLNYATLIYLFMWSNFFSNILIKSVEVLRDEDIITCCHKFEKLLKTFKGENVLNVESRNYTGRFTAIPFTQIALR